MPAFGSPKAGMKAQILCLANFFLLQHGITAPGNYFSSAKYLMVRTIWLV